MSLSSVGREIVVSGRILHTSVLLGLWGTAVLLFVLGLTARARPERRFLYSLWVLALCLASYVTIRHLDDLATCWLRPDAYVARRLWGSR